MSRQKKRWFTRGAFWATFSFYALIAFEFFYMFSPFAIYLYGVYGPGLDFLAFSESTSWLIAFFMPHIARETTSFVITWHEQAGMILFMGGFIAFITGAFQIYWSKLKKRGAVIKGIYRHIRHPQYLALMISSFGMVLIWPRYLVLFGFITVCFAYFLLARLEEKICLREFSGYVSYMNKTGMFLPYTFERRFHSIPWPSGRLTKMISLTGLYVLLLFFSFSGAQMIHSYSINSLYTFSTPQEVYLSVGRLEQQEFEELIHIAHSDPEVSEFRLNYQTPESRFINYVMPADLLISEIPMYIPEGRTPSHRSPHKEDQARYKIIFTLADFGPADPSGTHSLEILRKAINKSPVLEIRIDRTSGQVEQIFERPADKFYSSMPVPVF